MDYFIMILLVMAENIKEFLNGWCSDVPFAIAMISLVIITIWSFIRVLNIGSTTSGKPDWHEKDESTYIAAIPILKKTMIVCFIISFVFSFLSAITPNMKQAALIYTVPKIINNKNIQELPNNVLILFNESIKELTAVVKGEVTTLAKDVSKEASDKAKEQIQEVSKVVKNEIKEKIN